jgi:hypothetical protein
VAADLITSGEPVLVGVADVPRRRVSLEALVAGVSSVGLAVASWSALERAPGIAAGFQHIVGLDPPPGGLDDPLLRPAWLGHAAWGAPEAEFALAVWTAELELRPALVDAWRRLRAGEAIPSALCGSGRYPRSPECCGRLLRVLTELGLVDFDPAAQTCRVIAASRTELERSASYCAYRRRLAAIVRTLEREPAMRAAAA